MMPSRSYPQIGPAHLAIFDTATPSHQVTYCASNPPKVKSNLTWQFRMQRLNLEC